MSDKTKAYLLLTILAIALIAICTGIFLMVRVAIGEFGWAAILSGRSISGLFAIKTMWHIEAYRNGFAMSIIGNIILGALYFVVRQW